MRVIKEGNVKSLEVIHKICGYCSCEFEFESVDMRFDHRDGYYVICPTCGKFLNTKP